MKPLKYNDKIVGFLEGDNFVKKVEPEKYLMRALDAYGIQEGIFKKVKGRANKVRIIEQKSKVNCLKGGEQIWRRKIKLGELHRSGMKVWRRKEIEPITKEIISGLLS